MTILDILHHFRQFWMGTVQKKVTFEILAKALGRNPNCEVQGPITIYINITITDQYFFVFLNNDWSFDSVEINIDYYFDRTLYDTSYATQTCLNKHDCHFTYLHEHCKTIVKMLPFTYLDMDSITANTSLEPRLW